MAKQGINTGTAPNDGTGDTLLAGTLKINANFDEVYDVFGDGDNLISFVSFATTAGYSTNAGIASTSTYAQTARYVTSDIDINTSGVVTTSYADIGKITIQQPGAITDGPIEVGFAATMFRIKADGMVGIGTSLPTSQLQVASFSSRPALWAIAKDQGPSFRASDEDITPDKTFIVTKDANIGIGTNVPAANQRLDVRGNVTTQGIVTLDGTVDFNSDITETVVNDFNDNITVSAAGTLTVDLSQGTVVLGGITTSINTWNFTNVTTLNSKATTATLVINAGVGYTYGDAVNVNGGPIAGGVRWVGGNPPPASDGEDILTFSIIRDSTGLTRVYCSSSINIS